MPLDNQSPELFGQTPWQTVGPFFHYGLPWKGGADLTGGSDLGARPELAPDGHFLLREPSARGAVSGTAPVWTLCPPTGSWYAGRRAAR